MAVAKPTDSIVFFLSLSLHPRAMGTRHCTVRSKEKIAVPEHVDDNQRILNKGALLKDAKTQQSTRCRMVRSATQISNFMFRRCSS